MNDPTVSVIITAHDRPEYLKTAIESVLAQTHPADEILVIDDASPTPLEPALEPYAPRVVHHRLAMNVGASVARNFGISRAKGEFVAFLDDDDAWFPEKLERQLAVIGGRDACLCASRGMESDAVIGKPGEVVCADDLRELGWHCGTSGLLARRDALLAISFDPALAKGQDWDVFVQLVQRGPLAYVPEPLFHYRDGAHDRITMADTTLTFEAIDQRMAANHKHRRWLGERAYRNRIVSLALDNLPQKRRPASYLAYALTKGGPRAIASNVWRRLRKRLVRR